MAKGGSLSGVSPAEVAEIRKEDSVNIGEMQRKLSLWAEQDQSRKFYGLFDLEDRDGPTDGKPGAVKAACPVWGGGSENRPMKRDHAAKQKFSEALRPVPTLRRSQVCGPGRQERRRVAIPSVLVNGHLFVGSPADTVATYRVRG